MAVCLWTGDYFSGWFVGFSQPANLCEGWRFEGTVFQDHVWSIWNRWSEPITLWDRFADGSFRYNKYAWLPGGYSHDTKFTHIMDAWVWDHYNNCTSLYLYHLT